MAKFISLMLLLGGGAVIGSTLMGLYFLKGLAPSLLLSGLGYLLALFGALSFFSLCGCVFVSEQTRQRRLGLMVFALGCGGLFIALKTWLEPVEKFACALSDTFRSRRGIDEAVCYVVTSLPSGWQNPAWFVVLLSVLVLSVWLAGLGWKIYLDQR